MQPSLAVRDEFHKPNVISVRTLRAIISTKGTEAPVAIPSKLNQHFYSRTATRVATDLVFLLDIVAISKQESAQTGQQHHEFAANLCQCSEERAWHKRQYIE